MPSPSPYRSGGETGIREGRKVWWDKESKRLDLPSIPASIPWKYKLTGQEKQNLETKWANWGNWTGFRLNDYKAEKSTKILLTPGKGYSTE